MQQLSKPRAIFAALALCTLTAAAAPAVASTFSTPESAAASAKAETKKAKKSSTKVKVLPGGSGETPAERSNRLRRECRGRVNAGACEGYTS